MHLNTVGRYIRRSPYQAIAATLIMALTFFTISVFLVISYLSVKIINYYGTKPQVIIILKDTATAQDIDSLKNQLALTGKTSSIKYISKQDAVGVFKKLNGENDPILNEIVSSDALPDILNVQASQPQYTNDLVAVAQRSPSVDQVEFFKDVIDKFIKFVNAVKIIGIFVISVLMAVAVFIILTIIGIKITIRRDEIETMRLIGATNSFIRMPFLLEGAFYGLVGAFIGWVVTYGILLYFQNSLSSFFNGIPLFPLGQMVMLVLLAGELAAAIILGIFASFLAVLRYLK